MLRRLLSLAVAAALALAALAPSSSSAQTIAPTQLPRGIPNTFEPVGGLPLELIADITLGASTPPGFLRRGSTSVANATPGSLTEGLFDLRAYSGIVAMLYVDGTGAGASTDLRVYEYDAAGNNFTDLTLNPIGTGVVTFTTGTGWYRVAIGLGQANAAAQAANRGYVHVGLRPPAFAGFRVGSAGGFGIVSGRFTLYGWR